MTLDQINEVDLIAETAGINFGCVAMLLALRDGPLTAGVAAMRTGYTRSGTSRRIRALEKAKLIVCDRRSEKDRREVTLTITPRGTRVAEEVRAV